MKSLVKSVSILGFVALLTVPFAIADEHGRRRRDSMELEEILEGLEHGMHALKALDRERELKMLQRVANEVRERMQERERGDSEEAIARRQLRALRIAFELYERSEGEKMGRLAEMVEHAVHARELRLEGRRDREARKVYDGAPNQGNVIELLSYAAKLLEKRGHGDRAHFVDRIAKEMQGHRKRGHEKEAKRGSAIEERVARLERSVARLARIIERLVDELEDDDDDEEEEDDDR